MNHQNRGKTFRIVQTASAVLDALKLQGVQFTPAQAASAIVSVRDGDGKPNHSTPTGRVEDGQLNHDNSDPVLTKGPPGIPTSWELRAAREAAGLTPIEAAKLVHTTGLRWQHYESGDRTIHPALWELFCIKSGTRTAP